MGRRCEYTGNPCGTDTWVKNQPCVCAQCQAWLCEYNDDLTRQLAEAGIRHGHRQKARFHPKSRRQKRRPDGVPVRLSHEAGDDVGEVKNTGKQKHLLHGLVISLDHKPPDKDGAERHGDISADAEDLQARRDAGELPLA